MQLASGRQSSQSPCGLRLLRRQTLLHQNGTLLLHLLQLGRLVRVWLEKSVVQDIHCCVMYFLPDMKATTLTQGANCIWEGMVKVMEQDFVPSVATAKDQSHGLMQNWPSAVWIA